MRFFAPVLALLAAIALAQQRYNVISNGSGGLAVTAGQQLTITWENPSSGTVTIKLTQGSVVEAGDGITLAANINANAGTATFQIPEGSQLNGQPYNIEIIDDTNPDNINFSGQFIVAGASGTGSTTSAASSATGSSSSESMSATSSAESSSMTSGSSSAHATSTRASASRTSTSSGANSTSSAPSANDAPAMKAGGLLAVMVAAIAAF